MGSILSVYFLFEIINFENVRNTVDSISQCTNVHLKQKEPWPTVAALGFKLLIL